MLYIFDMGNVIIDIDFNQYSQYGVSLAVFHLQA